MTIAPHSKEFLGVLAPAISCIGDVTYIVSIVRGRTRPHAFSWLVWDLTVIVVFFGQITAGAGAGAWLTGYNALICSAIAALAWKRGTTELTRGDKIVLAASLLGLPVWAATKDPLWSICLETAVSAGVYYPTIRKSYSKPFSENAFSYVMFAVPFAIDLLAMDSYSPTTIIYPVYAGLSHIGFAAMLLVRRRTLRGS